MGILGLAKFIGDVAPSSIHQTDIKSYFGRKIAIDASMSLYQFLIAVRSEGNQLTSVDGETTSHLVGIFYRTIRLIENGIKPVYVFDGKPPEMKSGELLKRAERREEAQKGLQEAEESGDVVGVDKFSKRLVKVNSKHVRECKELLKLMGIPFIEAPCEAEAQCAAMAKAGVVYGTATEDMDSLTFGSPIVIRHLTFSEARKIPVQEYSYQKVLDGLEMSTNERKDVQYKPKYCTLPPSHPNERKKFIIALFNPLRIIGYLPRLNHLMHCEQLDEYVDVEIIQFIDLCILFGCDYCDSIKGIGPKRAFELIKQYRSIPKILESIDRKKYPVPENWCYEKAKELFITPEVLDPKSIVLKWTEPDEEGLVKFLCGDKQFSEERVRNGAKKLAKARTGTTQGRLDSFFTVLPSSNATKRKIEETKSSSAKKNKSGGGKFRGKPK